MGMICCWKLLTNKYAKNVFLFLIGVCLGIWVGFSTASEKEKPIVGQKPVIKTESVAKNEISYVPKRNKSESDVEIVSDAPKVSFNGKHYVMEKLPSEEHKFDNGKVLIKQGYELKIDASDFVPKDPKWGMNVGYSNHGYVIGVERYFNRNVSIGVMGTPIKKEGKDKILLATFSVRF